MKIVKLLVPFVLAGVVSSAIADVSATAAPVDAMAPVSFAPVAMVVVHENRNSEMGSRGAQVVERAEMQREEGDFTLALAGALMVCMVVLKRFSR
jgi:hypothetical protein